MTIESDEQYDDETVIRLVLSGKKELFALLVERHQDRVYTTIARQIGDRDAARDLAQEVFLRVYRGLKTFSERSKFSTWLYRISLNVVQSYYVSKSFRSSARSVELLEVHTEGLIDPTAENRAREELLLALRRAVGELPQHYREVIVLVSFEGRTAPEAAEILEIPVGTVYSRTNMALQILRKKLQTRVQ